MNSTAFSDQMQAAVEHADALGRRFLAPVGPVEDSSLIPAHVPALVDWNDVMTEYTDLIVLCPHVGDSPMPVFGRIDTPGTLACGECFHTVLSPLHLAKDTGAGNSSCDGCSRQVTWLTPVAIRHGVTLLVGHLCDDCRGRAPVEERQS